MTKKQRCEALSRKIFTLNSPAGKDAVQLTRDQAEAEVLRVERDKLRKKLNTEREQKRADLMVHADRIKDLRFRLQTQGNKLTFDNNDLFALRVAWELFQDTRNAGIQRAVRAAKK